MKKSNITLIALEILLIILVISNSIFNTITNDVRKELKENEIASLNQILKYKIPEGYYEEPNISGEIAISTEDGNSYFSIEIFNNDDIKPNEIFTINEQANTSLTLVSENTLDEKGKKTTKKVYKSPQFFRLIGTIEMKNNPNQFIAIVGDSTTQDTEETLDFLLSTIEYTKQSINKERLFSSDFEKTTIIVPSNWKRLDKNIPYSFYKEVDNNITYLIAISSTKEEENPQEVYESIKNPLSTLNTATITEDSNVTNVGNKTITNTTIKYDDNQTVLLTLIEFKDSNVFTIVRTDIVSENNNIDYIKSDIEYIINSIKLK